MFGGSNDVLINRGPPSVATTQAQPVCQIQVKSREEVIEWVKRVPFDAPESEPVEIEIRQVFEAEDFGEAFTPELREQEERLRAEAAELGKSGKH